MSIKSIGISNFKSFSDLNIELGNFNVLIGANASGKSNFVQLFEFLRDVTQHGLDNAVSMQGGVQYLRNMSIGSSEDLSFKASCDLATGFARAREKGLIVGIRARDLAYKFTMKFAKRGQGFQIREDELSIGCRFVRLQRQSGRMTEQEGLGDGRLTISKSNGRIDVRLDKPPEVPLEEDDIFPPLFRRQLPKTLLIEAPFLVFPLVGEIFQGISIYDFDPTLAKRAVPITGKTELEEDGSNLAIVLNNIIKNQRRKREFFNLLKDLLPFVAKVDVEKFADKSLLFKLTETYAPRQYLPASLISHGTINIVALIIALYFEKKQVVIVEEPERSIHPYLMSKVVDIIKEASKKKQIIVTTHNPEVVRHVDLQDILLVSRDKQGFSTIYRPSEKPEVKTFLENEIGIEELYTRDLLGV